MPLVKTGLDVLLSDPGKYIPGKTIGLVVNHTSIAADLKSSISQFNDQKEFHLKKLFAPEHGLYAIAQDMESVANEVEPSTGIPVISLYGKSETSLTPDHEMLDGIETLIFDIQDIGSRYYTFMNTLANCMKVCGQVGVPIIVCDRPNPINGIHLEGNGVQDNYQSFVGQYSIPNRHGMTIGELAVMFRNRFKIGCDLTVVRMEGWKREMWFDETGLPWVAPSPNMPTLTTAMVYPGMCLVEGTQLSEGRGTTQPFELCGAPYINADQLAAELNGEALPGIVFRPHYFKPKFQKHADQVCGGIQLHVTDRNIFKPVITGIAVLRAAAKLHFNDFAWRTEPYEFVSKRPAIDLLYGNSNLRKKLAVGNESLKIIEDSWETEIKVLKNIRNDYLIY